MIITISFRRNFRKKIAQRMFKYADKKTSPMRGLNVLKFIYSEASQHYFQLIFYFDYSLNKSKKLIQKILLHKE